jgi:lipopolysaccharide export system permease protein
MQFLWRYIDELVGKGLEWTVIAELMMYASASLIPMALPLAILMASLMTFGNLGEHNELTALKSSGISLVQILSPLIIFTIILSILAFLFSNHVLPYSNLKMRSLIYDIRQQRPEFQLKEGVFNNNIDDFSFRVNYKDPKTGLLKDIIIYDHTEQNGNTKVTIADSGYMKMTANKAHLIVTLYHGRTYIESNENISYSRKKGYYPHRKEKFDKQTFYINMDGFDFERTSESLFRNHYQMMNIKQLKYYEDSIKKLYLSNLNSFQNYFLTAYLFKKETLRNDTASKHYINKTILAKIAEFNCDSVLKSLSPIQYNNVVDYSTSYARSAKSYISSSRTELEQRARMIRKYRIEWYKKFTLSFACFIFFFIGAPLGAIIRKGGIGLPAVISVVFFMLYYAVSISGEKFANQGIWDPFMGMWIASFILLPIGVFLTYKSTNDSTVLNLDTYIKFFNKINIFKKIISDEEENENSDN